MELDYSQFVAEDNPDDVRCVLTTDAKAAFQSASRHNCHKVLCTEGTLREQLTPFLHMLTKALSVLFGLQQTCHLNHHRVLLKASKLFTCNTASLVKGLQDAG